MEKSIKNVIEECQYSENEVLAIEKNIPGYTPENPEETSELENIIYSTKLEAY